MRKAFITGLIILLPLALTIMIIVFLFDFFTAPFVPLVKVFVDALQKQLTFELPEGLHTFLARLFSLIFLCILVFVLGFIARWFLIKHLLKWGNRLLSKIPIVKSIYKMSREVFSALFSTDGKKAFKHPVMLPFPDHPNYTIGFVTGEIAPECQEKTGKTLVPVFTPTAPHPITGFLILVPEELIHEIDMTNEDAVKFLVSCGLILPASEMKAGESDS